MPIRRKLLIGHMAPLLAILLTILVRAMAILRNIKSAELFGYTYNPSDSFKIEMIEMLLLAAFSFLIMNIDLLLQHSSFKKSYVKDIDIRPAVVASIVGVALYLLEYRSHSDGLGTIAAYTIIPIIQLAVFIAARVCNHMEEKNLEGK